MDSFVHLAALPEPEPDACSAYWAWVARPESVTGPDRLRLIWHTAVCAACLQKVMSLLNELADRSEADAPTRPRG